MNTQTITFNSDTTEILTLQSEYTKIVDEKGRYYGGDQRWFRGMPYYGIISPSGCGVIAMCDICLYISGQSSRNRSPLTDDFKNGQIGAQEYIEYVKSFNDLYINLHHRMDPIGRRFQMNNLDGKTGKIMTTYFKSNMIPLKVKAHSMRDVKDLGGGPITELDSYKEICGSIRNDLPVIIGISPSSKENAIPMYVKKRNQLVFGFKTSTQNHYVTVTGVFTDRSGAPETSVMYQVSSWGKEYYINAADLHHHLTCGQGLLGKLVCKFGNNLTVIDPRG